MTITLTDIYMLTDLRIIGSMQPYDFLSAGSKKLAKILDCTGWTSYILNHIRDGSTVAEREHVSFLNMWLERFIFCESSCSPTFNHKYLAERLATSNEIPLRKYLLGSAYHLMHQVAVQLLKNEPVHTISGPWWLIQLCSSSICFLECLWLCWTLHGLSFCDEDLERLKEFLCIGWLCRSF